MAYDEDFEKDLRELAESNPAKAERVADLAAKIRRHPFKGEMKQYAMDGLYGLHIDPHVLLYELDPHLAPNHAPTEVDEIYFHRVIHHDDQQTAVTNVDRATRTTYVSIRLDYDTIASPQRIISQLHETDEFRFVEPEYDPDGVSVTGELVDGTHDSNREILRSIVPDKAVIEFDSEGFSDFI